jgi:hypothetical protein
MHISRPGSVVYVVATSPPAVTKEWSYGLGDRILPGQVQGGCLFDFFKKQGVFQSCACGQGCQMVYFQTKKPHLGKFWKWKKLVYFMAIGIYHVHSVDFMVIW